MDIEATSFLLGRTLGEKILAVRRAEAAEAELASLREERDALLAQNKRKGACLAFFASVIKCGEPWTETCERMYRAAQAALGQQEDGNGD